ncbi:MAG: ABC transporter permease [Bdellovibrionales bacterium]|nr:ABC transporter permease [Bdellovibrionales bacterium]
MLETLKLSWHIVRRNWWVYRKDFLANISPTVTDAAFPILSFGIGLGALVTNVEGRSYIAYLAPGLAVTTAMFTAFFETSYGFYVRMTYENIFKAMLTTPIGVNEIVIGEFIWVALKGALMVTGVSLVLLGFGMFTQPLNLLLAPLAGILMALPLGCMGLLATCYVRNINQFQTVYSFLISPLYFFSGVFFPLTQMPEWLQILAKALPLYHGVRLSQSMFWNEDVLATWLVHGPILIAYSAVMLAWTFRQVRRKLET